MRTVQGTIVIKNYTARLEQAITNPERTHSYVISANGQPQSRKIDHALFYFEQDDSPYYGKGDVSIGHRIRIFLNYKDYDRCIDLLRNEKPVYFHYSYLSFDDENNGTSFDQEPELQYYSISTKKEPIGDGE